MEILDLLTNIDSQIAAFIGAYGNLVYLFLFTIVFLEIGVFPFFFLPGNPLIFVAGSFCSLGSLHLAPTLFTLISAAFLGNMVSYKIGNAFAHKLNDSQSSWGNPKAMKKAKTAYAKYGQLTLMISGFIAVVRTFAPLLAGVSQMPYRQYVFASTAGAIIWVSSLVTVGYFFSNIAFIQMHMASIVLSGLAVGLGFVVYGLIKSRARR
jgi:membrane-associated protein